MSLSIYDSCCHQMVSKIHFTTGKPQKTLYAQASCNHSLSLRVTKTLKTQGILAAIWTDFKNMLDLITNILKID